MPLTVLVVDEDFFVREMLKDLFSIAGYNVISADNGKEGLNKIEKFFPDFVLLGVSMPLMEGFETLERIRSNPKFINLPVMMFSTMLGEKEQIKGLNLGADDYIMRPFKPLILLARVKNILDRKKRSIDVNPLTRLPGNLYIKETIEKNIRDKIDFSLVYIDLANFKSFNDKYGFYCGDEVIKFVANLLQAIVKKFGASTDFVGHIGGDDFVIITKNDNSIVLAENIINDFDKGIKQFYNEEDLKKGYIVSTDRDDNVQKIPIMTIAVCIIATDVVNLLKFEEISTRVAQLKKLAKQNKKSSYIFERRRECR